MHRVWLAASLLVGILAISPAAQSGRDATFDHILDTYVRDGYVYYNALRIERASLDRYVASLDVPADQVAAWPKKDQEAFWLNAYDALVLQTVIDHYPIRGKSTDYPPNSIRQIYGAFDGVKHRAGGRSLTLDEIETTMIAPFGDARLLLAIGRGALGGGRLKSEVYVAARLDAQVDQAVKEFSTRPGCVKVDPAAGMLEVSPLFSWREGAFIASFAEAPGAAPWKARSPIERAVVALVAPNLFASERAYLTENTFRMTYGTFDWRLNDLNGER